MGVAQQTYDNSAGADGAIFPATLRRAAGPSANNSAGDAITIAEVGKTALRVVDNNTVARRMAPVPVTRPARSTPSRPMTIGVRSTPELRSPTMFTPNDPAAGPRRHQPRDGAAAVEPGQDGRPAATLSPPMMVMSASSRSATTWSCSIVFRSGPAPAASAARARSTSTSEQGLRGSIACDRVAEDTDFCGQAAWLISVVMEAFEKEGRPGRLPAAPTVPRSEFADGKTCSTPTTRSMIRTASGSLQNYWSSRA